LRYSGPTYYGLRRSSMAGATETKAQLRAREVGARDALRATLDAVTDGQEEVSVVCVDTDTRVKPYFNRGLLFRVGGRWYKASIRAYDPTADAGDRGD
jgi:hypothetical protein